MLNIRRRILHLSLESEGGFPSRIKNFVSRSFKNEADSVTCSFFKIPGIRD